MELILHLENLIRRYPELDVCKKDIFSAFQTIRDAYLSKGMLLVCGNGGSAADSEHIVGELMKEFAKKRPLSQNMKDRFSSVAGIDGEYLADKLQGGLPAITLTSNLSFSTAFANDVAHDLVFAQQVFVYGKKESILLGISTSGNSRNIIYAFETAKALNMKTIALTGNGGGKLREIADISIIVPRESTPEIQELHLPIYHTICLMLEDAFF